MDWWTANELLEFRGNVWRHRHERCGRYLSKPSLFIVYIAKLDMPHGAFSTVGSDFLPKTEPKYLLTGANQMV
jgi:hypothetical protein